MKTQDPQAILIADLGYGDAGKGSIVDYLGRTRGAHTVVRYNGGAQAAHNVVTPDGQHHTFAQFGSGTFVPGVRTHLSRFMMLNPLAMLAEERHLSALGVRDSFPRTSIDRRALVTTPFQQSANRVKEMARGEARHGSCGMGVGETMADWLAVGDDALFAADLEDRARSIRKLKRMRDRKLAQLQEVLKGLPPDEAIGRELEPFHDPGFIAATADVYAGFASQVDIVGPEYLAGPLERPGAAIFEGAQGVLLDEWYGFYPYNSWSTLTFKNADALLAEAGFSGEVLKLGLLRGYLTRHGAGPFVTEDGRLTSRLQDLHNRDNPWQRTFRVGYLDFVALRYALNVTGKVDGLVVTNLDRMDSLPEWRTCNRYAGPDARPHLQEYFDLRGPWIRDIKVPPDPTDLAKQEELTRLLSTMRPVYDVWPKDLDAYLELISETRGAPIAITSRGPTTLDKETFGRIPAGTKSLAAPASLGRN